MEMHSTVKRVREAGVAVKIECLIRTQISQLKLKCLIIQLILIFNSRFSKVPKTFRVRKAIRKTPTRLLCNAGFCHML